MSIYEIDLRTLGHANDVRVKAFRCLEGLTDARILDVGCAAGDMGVLLKSREASLSVDGTDIDQGSLDLAAEKGCYDILSQFDLDQNLDDLPFSDAAYDAILLLDVLEHTRYPDAVLERLTRLLKEDGKILVSVPNVTFGTIKSNLIVNSFKYTETGILDRTHLRFLTRNTLVEELGLGKFKVDGFDFTIRPINILPALTKNPLVFFVIPAILFSRDSHIYQFFFIVSRNQPQISVTFRPSHGVAEWLTIITELSKKIYSRTSRMLRR